MVVVTPPSTRDHGGGCGPARIQQASLVGQGNRYPFFFSTGTVAGLRITIWLSLVAISKTSPFLDAYRPEDLYGNGNADAVTYLDRLYMKFYRHPMSG